MSQKCKQQVYLINICKKKQNKGARNWWKWWVRSSKAACAKVGAIRLMSGCGAHLSGRGNPGPNITYYDYTELSPELSPNNPAQTLQSKIWYRNQSWCTSCTVPWYSRLYGADHLHTATFVQPPIWLPKKKKHSNPKTALPQSGTFFID
jgi:hypothetical protein